MLFVKYLKNPILPHSVCRIKEKIFVTLFFVKEKILLKHHKSSKSDFFLNMTENIKLKSNLFQIMDTLMRIKKTVNGK